MPGILDDLEGLQLVGMNVDAVLIGGADEGEETGRDLLVPQPEPRLPRARGGRRLYCLHKNRWWQTADGPRLDAGAFVAGLEYAADTEATVLGKPSAAYFEAALEALDAEPELTWMVGDDLESDCVGAHQARHEDDPRAHRQVPARRGRAVARPAGRASSRRSRSCPIGSRPIFDGVMQRRRRPDRDRADPPRARAARRRLPRALLHRGRARVLRLEAEPAAALRRTFRGEGGGRQGARLGRRTSRGRRSRFAAGPKPGVFLTGRTAAWAEKVGAGTIELSMTHSRELAAAVAVVIEADA